MIIPIGNVAEAGLECHYLPVDSRNTDVHQIIGSLPLLFELMTHEQLMTADAVIVFDGCHTSIGL